VCYGLIFCEFRPLRERNGNIAWMLLQALAKRLRVAEKVSSGPWVSVGAPRRACRPLRLCGEMRALATRLG
jgi:hypothetical protein